MLYQLYILLLLQFFSAPTWTCTVFAGNEPQLNLSSIFNQTLLFKHKKPHPFQFMTYDAPALFDESEQSLLFKHQKPHPFQVMTYDAPALFDQLEQVLLFKHKKPNPFQVMTYDAPALFDQSEQSFLFKHQKPHTLPGHDVWCSSFVWPIKAILTF